jgi:hypothetical protein
VIRRGFWLAAGFGLGVAAATQVRRAATAAVPARVADRVRRDITGALTEGRREMQVREAELRRVLAAPGEQRGAADPGQ